MDDVWVAYIIDHSKNPPLKILVGIFDSQRKAEQAINIVLRQKCWRGKSYHPNVWKPPERYEYGWKSVPFNQFNTEELFCMTAFI